MNKELTQSQQLEIYDHSEEFTIVAMAEKYEVPYNTIYNFLRKHKLKYAFNEGHAYQKRKNGPNRVSHDELMKERSAVVPDPPRKWERPAATYSNIQRDELIDKILNDEKV